MAKINLKEKKFTIMFHASGEDVNTVHTVITKKIDRTGDKNFTWASYIKNVFIISCYENTVWDHDILTDEIKQLTDVPFLVAEIKDGNIQGWLDPEFWKWWGTQKNRTSFKLNSERRKKLLKIKKIAEDKVAEKLRLEKLVKREKELKWKKKLLAIKKEEQAEVERIRLEYQNELKRIEKEKIFEENRIRIEEQRVEFELNGFNKPEPTPVVEEVIYEEVKTSFWEKYFNF